MIATRALPPTYHVLLIGVDAYTIKPLHGCVNDIDAVQDLLLGGRVGLTTPNIRRLASPHPGTTHKPLPGEQPATLANIRAAFTELAAKEYEGDHRVFIYYSGHGTRAPVTTTAGKSHREALVPVDFNAAAGPYQLFYDFEFNRQLAAIVKRGAAVTVILDCCNSAGSTRELPIPSDTEFRVIDFEEDLGFTGELTLSDEQAERGAGDAPGVAGGVDECHVVAACLSHELAQESRGADGVRHGLLTRALIERLAALPNDADLRATPWARIWQSVRADVEIANPNQHVWMAGDTARAVLAGRHVGGDMGLGVGRKGTSNTYTVDAGTVSSVTVGAEIAVYGVDPAFFPPLDSDEDKAARLGLLRVTAAESGNATAAAVGQAFALPQGARGRLVKAGEPERLRCAIVPPDAAVAAAMAASDLLKVVDATQAQVKLKRRDAEAVWDLIDDVHLGKVGPKSHPVLCSLSAADLDLAPAVMEQYFYYSLPLRMAAACKDLPGALKVSLLRCTGVVPAQDADKVVLPEVATSGTFNYEVTHGDLIAIRVRNTSDTALRVSLLNVASSGRVQYLGSDTIDGGTLRVFWYQSNKGNPFPAKVPNGAKQSIDRLVAIGTTELETDLQYLKVSTTFAKIATRELGLSRELGDDSPPASKWTAAQIVWRCNRP